MNDADADDGYTLGIMDNEMIDELGREAGHSLPLDSFLFSPPPSELRTPYFYGDTTHHHLNLPITRPYYTKSNDMHPYISITTLLSVVAVAISPVASFVQPNPVSRFMVTRLNLENHIADM